MNEITFQVTEAAEGGFSAEAIGESIFTQADSWDELKADVKEAVQAFISIRLRRAPSGCIWFAMRCWQSHEAAEKPARRRAGQTSLQVLGILKSPQVGSHIILQMEHPKSHRMAIPAHHPLKVGTLNAILADVAAHKNALKEAILKDL